VVLDHGRVLAEGTSDQLKARAGGQVLEVRPADGNLSRVAAVLAGVAGGSPAVDADTRLVTVPAADPVVLAEVVRRLDAAGVAVADLALRRPSLDDVFLRLTGRTSAARDEQAADAEERVG
jgi:ABC-type multidrug transport system ATPase subunit